MNICLTEVRKQKFDQYFTGKNGHWIATNFENILAWGHFWSLTNFVKTGQSNCEWNTFKMISLIETVGNAFYVATSVAIDFEKPNRAINFYLVEKR